MYFQFTLFSVLLFLVGGCAHLNPSASVDEDMLEGPSVASVDANAGSASLFKEDQAVMSDAELEKALSAKLTPTAQAKIVIVRYGRLPRWWGWSPQIVHATEQLDRQVMDRLRAAKTVSDVSYLPALITPNVMSVPHLRQAAARCQADLMVIYRATTQSYTRQRAFSRDQTRAYCTVEALLLDTRTGLIPFSTSTREDFTAKKSKNDLDFSETIANAEQQALGKAWGRLADEIVGYLNQKRDASANATTPRL